MDRSSPFPHTLILRQKGTLEVKGITDHSAKVEPGFLYFAIPGSQFDGHSKVTEALARGATAVVVEREDVYQQAENAILVRSTREAWAVAVSKWFEDPSRCFPLVGVTGTNGKTTTTYLLSQVWERLRLQPGLIGTVECRVGDRRLESGLTTPGPWELQSLLAQMREASVDYAAMEVSSIALDQYRTAGTTFAAAVFTNLTQDHLDYHGSFDRYWESKVRLFREYGIQKAIINCDDPRGEELVRRTTAEQIFCYSTRSARAEFFLRSPRFDRRSAGGEVVTPEGAFPFEIPLIGIHNLYNALSVLATCHALGLACASVIEALKTCPGAPGRLERVPVPAEGPGVFVDYAHSPDAIENVLQALQRLRGAGRGRIITVFGCGGDRDRGKRPLMADIACRLSDVVWLTSDNPRTEDPDAILDDIQAGVPRGLSGVHREANRRLAIEQALHDSQPDDILLIAGKGHENYQIVGREKFPFDDREVVREYYA